MSSTLPTAPATNQHSTPDPLRLIDVDYVQFYVGNAKQAAYFYAHSFGFEIEQLADLTTGVRDSATYLLTQGNIRFLLTSGLNGEHPAAQEFGLCRLVLFPVNHRLVGARARQRPHRRLLLVGVLRAHPVVVGLQFTDVFAGVDCCVDRNAGATGRGGCRAY